MIGLACSPGHLAALCRRHQVRELSVFGCVARGDNRPDSDIDVLVEFEPAPRIGFNALWQLTCELAELLGQRVDVVIKHGLHPRIRDAVLADAQVLFAA